MTVPLVPVSIVVPVRDEARGIPGFLAAHSWAAEIVLVDNGSRDDSGAIGTRGGATVISAPLATIGEARNAGADAARSEWILALDIDEVADPAVAAEIATVLAAPTHDAYRFRRRNFVAGREQHRGSMGRDWVARLYRRQLRFTSPKVHERLDTHEPVGTLQAPLSHHPYRDRAHYFEKADRYARWGAEQLFSDGRSVSTIGLVARPCWRFIKAYVLQGQLLDGREGLVAAMLSAQSAFLKYAYLWVLNHDADGRARSRP